MLADWLREWDRNRYRKSLRELREARKERVQAEQALKEAVQLREQAEQASKKEVQQWQAWYHRQQAALQAGIPFDEPPPFLTPNDNGAENNNGR